MLWNAGWLISLLGSYSISMSGTGTFGYWWGAGVL